MMSLYLYAVCKPAVNFQRKIQKIYSKFFIQNAEFYSLGRFEMYDAV